MRRIPGANRGWQVFAHAPDGGDVQVALVPGAAGRIRVDDDESLRASRRRLRRRPPQLVAEDRGAGDCQDDEGDQPGGETLTPSAPSS